MSIWINQPYEDEQITNDGDVYDGKYLYSYGEADPGDAGEFLAGIIVDDKKGLVYPSDALYHLASGGDPDASLPWNLRYTMDDAGAGIDHPDSDDALVEYVYCTDASDESDPRDMIWKVAYKTGGGPTQSGGPQHSREVRKRGEFSGAISIISAGPTGPPAKDKEDILVQIDLPGGIAGGIILIGRHSKGHFVRSRFFKADSGSSQREFTFKRNNYSRSPKLWVAAVAAKNDATPATFRIR